MFPRYGLILFSIGIPILAWAYLRLGRARKLLTAIIVVCVLGAGAQLVGAVGLLNQISAQRAAGDFLRDHFDPKSEARIFCDEGTVTVMSGIPMERFVTSADAPKDREAFLAFLKEEEVEYLVYVKKEDSTLSALFQWPEYGEGLGSVAPVLHSHSEFLFTDIWVYRVPGKNAEIWVVP